MTDAPTTKVLCTSCRRWHGLLADVLTAPDPFNKGGVLTACPRCRQPGVIVEACDEPDCWQQVSCGTPTDSGYRRTCFQHDPHRRAK